MAADSPEIAAPSSAGGDGANYNDRLQQYANVAGSAVQGYAVKANPLRGIQSRDHFLRRLKREAVSFFDYRSFGRPVNSGDAWNRFQSNVIFFRLMYGLVYLAASVYFVITDVTLLTGMARTVARSLWLAVLALGQVGLERTLVAGAVDHARRDHAARRKDSARDDRVREV